MSQIGCHALVWTGSLDPVGFERAVRHAGAAGFDLLEVPLLDPATFDVASAQRVLQESPLSISASLGQSRDSDISSEDPVLVRAGEEKLNLALEVLHALGGRYLVGVLYQELRKYPEPMTERARQNGLTVLRRVARRAADLGIRLGLEVVNRYESNLLNTAKQALAYLDELDEDMVGVHLDTYHMHIEEPDMLEPVLAAADRLSYVHIGESHRGYLGSGSVDFPTFFRALAMAGYDGPIVFESFSSAVVHPELSRMLAVWRNLWEDSDDLGAHASTFIRNQLRAVETIRMH